MLCDQALSSRADLASALDEVCDRLAHGLGSRRPHLLVAFFTGHHTSRAEELRQALSERLQPEVLLGCPASGVIAGRRESEGSPGLVLWAAHWPGVELTPFSLRPVHGRPVPTLSGWPRPDEVPSTAGFLVLSDPFSAPSEVLLAGFSRHFRRHLLVGGLASASTPSHEGRLLSRDGVLSEGLVGVAIAGSVQLDAVVSQGCRPVGRHFVITAGSRHMIRELGGKPALAQLQALLEQADEGARRLMRSGALHVGRVINERKSRFASGDLLVRNVLGFDHQTQAIAISDHVRPGQTIQFMVRDPAAAHADLEQLLEPERRRPRPLGALMFSCNARGSRFFGRPNHDVNGLHRALGPLPTAGFFASGEIGPVGGRPFLHGLTASIALFRRRTEGG